MQVGQPVPGHKIDPVLRPVQNRGAPPRQSARRSALRWLCRRGCMVAMGLATAAAAVTAPAAAAVSTADAGQAAFADQVLAAVNHYRAQQALAAWPPDEALVEIALKHSRLMAGRSRLGHDGFDGRFQQARSRLCVETLAAGFNSADALVMGWRQSPTHHANLLEPKARRAGVASVDGYVTLLACD